MTINLSKFQNFGFHLVTKSPWPILLSLSLLNLAIGAVLCMQGFNQGSSVISLGLIITIFGMGLWFRDIVIEGTEKWHIILITTQMEEKVLSQDQEGK